MTCLSKTFMPVAVFLVSFPVFSSPCLAFQSESYFLIFRSDDGRVRVLNPVFRLDGVSGYGKPDTKPVFVLEEKLAKKWEPLLTPADWQGAFGEAMPPTQHGKDDVMVLIKLKRDSVKVRDLGNEEYVITEAEIEWLEWLSKEWLDALGVLRSVYEDLALLEKSEKAESRGKQVKALGDKARTAWAVFKKVEHLWRTDKLPHDYRLRANRVDVRIKFRRTVQGGVERRTRKVLEKQFQAFPEMAGFQLEEEKPSMRETTLEGFLYRDSQNHVWVSNPAVGLGMVGVTSIGPIRLSPDLAKELGPLVTAKPLLDEESRPFYWSHQLSFFHFRPPYLVTLSGVEQPLDPPEKKEWASPYETPRELVSADLIEVECLAPEWHEAWKALDDSISKLVAVTLEAPGEEKRKKIEAEVNRGWYALGQLVSSGTGEGDLNAAKKINPLVKLTNTFHRQIINSWGNVFLLCALQVADLHVPATPEWPQSLRGSSGVGPLAIMAESQSGEEFFKRFTQTNPSGNMNYQFLHSKSLGRGVRLYEIAELPPEWFDRIRKEARDQFSKDQERRKRKTPDWPGITMEPADSALRKEKGIISGWVVNKVGRESSPLKPGDIVLDYSHVYDIVMGRYWIADGSGAFGNLSNRREVRLLRDNKIVMVDAEKLTKQ